MPELPKAYDPKTVEKKWYHFWESKDFFHAELNSDKPPYCIVIPPPNVTGTLHMGHALTNTLQDVLIRWKRMSGHDTLWVPGTDHAGIATQTVVERHLMATTGKRHSDMPREEFLELVWEWKNNNESHIVNQLKKLGCSCDWSRQRFTMDDGCNAAVRKVFKKMYDDKLIYRGDYLVNWDPVTQTAIADDEVEYEDHQSYLWYFKYPLLDGSGYATIATTRPETMLGDTAVAVSPGDTRYTDIIGKTILLPLTGREIPIIANRHVDPEFGTGMVKITPAHDQNDYQIGMEHDLPFVNIMTPDGHINEEGREFHGMTMKEARNAVVNKMKELDLLIKVEPHSNRVGVSYRSKAIIEPYMSKQWFVKMDTMATILKDAIDNKHVSIIPKSWESTYFHWVNNLRDWCISRQLWWGHRIPIWYNKENPEEMICYDGEDVPPEVLKDPEAWYQDSDVLDTWFSSALWPFSALEWPEETPECDKFFPNNILITGHDILFFWVARMIAVGKYVLNEFPFEKVFLHGLIYGKSYWRTKPEEGIAYVSKEERYEYDMGNTPVPKDVHSKWEKMSKSKGNVIDPLELIDIYGTDAVRMALCATPSQLREIDLDRRRFEEFKNFTNKIWNGARFIFMNLGEPSSLSSGLNIELLSLEDKWILSTLNRIIRDVNNKLETMNFDHAAVAAYDFYWKDFCAYYMEIAKPVLYGKTGTAEEKDNKQKILTIILCNSIRLMHPMVPFITEELFQLLKTRIGSIELLPDADPYTRETVEALKSPACITSPFPRVIAEDDIDSDIEAAFDLVKEVIYTIRNIRGEMNLPPNAKTDVYIIGNEHDDAFKTLTKYNSIVSALVNNKSIEVSTSTPTAAFASTGIVGTLKILIPLPEELQEKERLRLEKEKERIAKSLERIQTQLNNNNFVERAPKALVEKQRDMLTQQKHELDEIIDKLSKLYSS